MERQVTVERTTTISDSGDVCHFDELSDSAKDTLTRLVRNDMTTRIEAEAANELVQYDVIKYTDYLKVSYDGPPASGSISA